MTSLHSSEVNPELAKTLRERWEEGLDDRIAAEEAKRAEIINDFNQVHFDWGRCVDQIVTMVFSTPGFQTSITGLLVVVDQEDIDDIDRSTGFISASHNFRFAGATTVVRILDTNGPDQEEYGHPTIDSLAIQPMGQYLVCIYCLQPCEKMGETSSMTIWHCTNPECKHDEVRGASK